MIKQKLAALCDDASIGQLEAAVGASFDILHARDERRLVALVQHETVVTVIVDHALAEKGAIALLQSIRSIRSDVKRVLLTDHCNLAIIIEGIHGGAVERIIYKPITGFEVVAAICPEELKSAAKRAGAAPAPVATRR